MGSRGHEGCIITHVLFCLEVARNTKLVLANGWVGLGTTPISIQPPTLIALVSCILLPRFFALDLHHCVHDMLHILFFGYRKEWFNRLTDIISSKDHASASVVDSIGWIYDVSNARDVGLCVGATINWLFAFLPETSFVLESNLQRHQISGLNFPSSSSLLVRFQSNKSLIPCTRFGTQAP